MGLLTAALAIEAHALAGGGAPPGSTAVLLSVLAVTAGALAATVDRTADARVLFGLLALGQLVAHVMLTIVGPHGLRHVGWLCGVGCHRPLPCSPRTRLRWWSVRH